MTQEEKAKAYDEALERARKIHNEILNNELLGFPEQIREIFPQLRESEDERIRKALIHIVKGACGKYGIKYRGDEISEEKLLSYLEKQKDLDKVIVVSPEVWDKAINDAYENGKKEGEKQKEQKPEEKPINWTELTWKDIVELEGIINNVHYEFSAGIGQKSFGEEVLERFRSTKGDEHLDEAEQKYCRKDEQKEQKPSLCDKCEKKPTCLDTKYGDDRVVEQCINFVEKKQKPAEWSEEEFEHIVGYLVQDIVANEHMPEGEKKPTRFFVEKYIKKLHPKNTIEWSEEDKRMLEYAEEMVNYCYCNHYVVKADISDKVRNWLQSSIMSLKNPTSSIKQGWSEEDERILERFLGWLQGTMGEKTYSSWLKSLRERFNLQPKQEWSEEDEDAINGAIGILLDDNNPTFVFPEHSKLSVGEIVKRLKSLPERLNLQPKQKWSEKDEIHRAFILESLEDQIRFCKKDAEGAHYVKQIRTAQNWLKSLPEKLNLQKEDTIEKS